jgi:wyosine [tRNA(Phe)-imidazoG37] synthetase (radical SAM superfamily)
MRKPDPDELERLILNSAIEANVLPVTSRCDSHCVFCSHRNNPPDINVFSAGVRSMDDITRTMAFLNPGHVITIGESSTPVIEGEPLSHPRFREIVSLIRRAFPETPVEITTNGRRLTRDMVSLLETAGEVSLNVSLNSASVSGRRLLMGDTTAQSEAALAGVRLLAASTIRFSASMVAMPNIVGWEDMRGTVEFLVKNRATVVRVFVPAFSSRANADLFPEEREIHARLRDFVDALSAESPCPILVEPSHVADLTPVVSGILRDSPAWRAGIRHNDILVTINGAAPRCRVEAWNMLLPEGDMLVAVRTGDREESIRWTNESEGDSGITMEYDFDPARAEDVGHAISSCPGMSVLLTSEFGHVVVGKALELVGIGADLAETVMIENRTFGGTIGAAGLLTVDDYREGYTAWRACNPAPAQVIVPLESFDPQGFDLKHEHFSRLRELTGVPVLLR